MGRNRLNRAGIARVRERRELAECLRALQRLLSPARSRRAGRRSEPTRRYGAPTRSAAGGAARRAPRRRRRPSIARRSGRRSWSMPTVTRLAVRRGRRCHLHRERRAVVGRRASSPPAEQPTLTAVATLQDGNGQRIGEATLTQEFGGRVGVRVLLDGAPPGGHAVHITKAELRRDAVGPNLAPRKRGHRRGRPRRVLRQ